MIVEKHQMAYFRYVEKEHTLNSPPNGKGVVVWELYIQGFFFYQDQMEINLKYQFMNI